MIILEDRSIFCRIESILSKQQKVYTAAFSRYTDNMHFSPKGQ